ncbi:hypothetical protein T484DRAFT_1802195 [Baffinella frigidus]|nr:hypothetical protein T484DRAFT_1802195 [Cryptophyta sp. CCMP2293]
MQVIGFVGMTGFTSRPHVIGFVGMTGFTSRPHVHFHVKQMTGFTSRPHVHFHVKQHGNIHEGTGWTTLPFKYKSVDSAKGAVLNSG